ncbi:MAG: DUF1795 domain-containing protein [Anaerolineae bacterium]|nr:DUF1795 domain-containing protein [Anaerolineae bacterium]
MNNYTVFEHRDFTLSVPSDWQNLTLSGFDAVFVVPPFPDGSGANVSVSVLEFTKVTSLQEVSDPLKVFQQGQYPEYHIIDERPFNLDQTNGFKRTYTWRNTAQDMSIAQFQVIFIDDSGYKAYILTATRPLDMESTEAQLLDQTFSEISASFSFNHEQSEAL